MRTLLPELLRALRICGWAMLGGADEAPAPPKVPPTATGLDAGVRVPPPKAELPGAVELTGLDIVGFVFGVNLDWTGSRGQASERLLLLPTIPRTYDPPSCAPAQRPWTGPTVRGATPDRTSVH